jgi:threonine dehydrogenase-like Zn-dependent dehydrogenase
MRALVWDGHAAGVVERPEPLPSPRMALVRVALAGICNTDLELVKGYMDFRGVLGHEFTGTVEDGPVEWRGRRVVAEINFACDNCPSCHRGLQRHCPARRVMGILDADGAFAEYVAVPVGNLHLVPDGVDDDAAVFAEPLAAAFEILEQIHVTPATKCVVLGDGKLGLLIAQVLFQAGADVLAVGKHIDKLAILRARGIKTVLAAEWDRTAADLVVEATGSVAGFATALAATRPRGTLVLKSTVADTDRLNLAPLVINEITVVGSRCGPFPDALRALASGEVNVSALLSAELPLSDGPAALAAAGRSENLKVLLDVWH